MTTVKKYLSVVILCLIVTPPIEADNNFTLTQQIEQLKAENQQLRQQVKQLQEQTQQAIAQKQAIYLIKTIDPSTRITTLRSYERALSVTHGRKQRYWYQIQTTLPPGTPAPGSAPGILGNTLKKTLPTEMQLQLRAPMSQGQLAQIKELRLQADGETLALPVIKHTSHRRRSGIGRAKVKLIDETLILKLTLSQIAQLSKAKKVAGQFAGTRFIWTREDHNLFRALALELASLPH